MIGRSAIEKRKTIRGSGIFSIRLDSFQKTTVVVNTPVPACPNRNSSVSLWGALELRDVSQLKWGEYRRQSVVSNYPRTRHLYWALRPIVHGPKDI